MSLDFEDQKFAKQLFEIVVEHELARGTISSREIEDGTYVEKIIQTLGKASDIVLIADHTKNILKRARRERGKSPEEAILHYALYIEHKINVLIHVLSERKNIERSATLSLMRELKLTSKATWALELLGGEPFDSKIVKGIGQISEERNAYAHYKWKEIEENNSRKQLLTKVFTIAETIVSEISSYEEKNLYGMKRSKLKKILSNFKKLKRN